MSFDAGWHRLASAGPDWPRLPVCPGWPRLDAGSSEGGKILGFNNFDRYAGAGNSPGYKVIGGLLYAIVYG